MKHNMFLYFLRRFSNFCNPDASYLGDIPISDNQEMKSKVIV